MKPQPPSHTSPGMWLDGSVIPLPQTLQTGASAPAVANTAALAASSLSDRLRPSGRKGAAAADGGPEAAPDGGAVLVGLGATATVALAAATSADTGDGTATAGAGCAISASFPTDALAAACATTGVLTWAALDALPGARTTVCAAAP
mmetsp:Transcript_38486/g.112656  ORF Transcript_38486/g.112656 Transcript_38486/m.112656 type:complete len:147 (-) Transcript_38486:153-593(-)